MPDLRRKTPHLVLAPRGDDPPPPAQATDLDQLYRRHAGWLGRFLRRRLGRDQASAEDLVQETYIRAARYATTGIAEPKALLRQIAVNLARDAMRRNVVRGGLAASIDDVAERGQPGDQETQAQLKAIILALPDPQRQVFLLSRFTAMTNEDIASHLGIAVKTVEYRLSKALALCLRHLRD